MTVIKPFYMYTNRFDFLFADLVMKSNTMLNNDVESIKTSVKVPISAFDLSITFWLFLRP